MPDPGDYPLKLTSWNVNGLRAALRKGFEKVISEIAPDVLILQEVRAFPEQLPEHVRQPDGWHVYWNPAERAGYSGTAVWSRYPLERVTTGIGPHWEDNEGRVTEVRTGGLTLASVYLPSGSSSPERQMVKDQWLEVFRHWADSRRRVRGPVVFGGDLNIAHTERDIFYARANEETSGFLPHEREWFSELLQSGWADVIREHAGDCDGPYSWWSNRGRARELDRGWRIDYWLCNRRAREIFQAAETHRELTLGISDHAPVSIQLDLSG